MEGLLVGRIKVLTTESTEFHRENTQRFAKQEVVGASKFYDHSALDSVAFLREPQCPLW